MHNPALIEWIRQASGKAELVLSVCTGAQLPPTLSCRLSCRRLMLPCKIADIRKKAQDQSFLKGMPMTPDWSQVTMENVRRASGMYDTGAAQPKRPAQSTFLLLNGKTYPAKFIRGLAYRLATGVELSR
jgi:hypothetical protein